LRQDDEDKLQPILIIGLPPGKPIEMPARPSAEIGGVLEIVVRGGLRARTADAASGGTGRRTIGVPPANDRG